MHAYLCGIYSCVARTQDGGKPCRSRSECEHLCVTDAAPALGADALGRCTALKSNFGCFTYVEGGRIAGRVCVD